MTTPSPPKTPLPPQRPRAEDVAFDACAVRLGQADHATGRVEIAIADLDVAPAQDRQPIAAAKADLQALAIAPIDLLGLGMAVVQIRPHPQSPQEDVAGLGVRVSAAMIVL